MPKKTQPTKECSCQGNKIDASEVDAAIIEITYAELKGLGAKLHKNHVSFDYSEMIEGQEFVLRLEFFATGGLYFVRGVLGTGIDISCKDCLANFHATVNALYADPVVFYGKVVLNGVKAEYNLNNYYPFSSDIQSIVSAWKIFLPVMYRSARKDITRFLTSLKKLSAMTAKHGCAKHLSDSATVH